MHLEKAEMFMSLAVSMYLKNRINVAIWASNESEKYLDKHEKGGPQNENQTS
ncbi:hypothetical protein [Niallia sp.]|uniref:hypothetical protein n=1 Tax=Niallia sp. TaxID=2837523 RepID=UPI0028A1C2E6|nr:hypothetical protein [Niallia sp.]